ncbi:hypothetical protein [Pedobacter punctiformis]|uniref:Lipocalin-like domain-containing protein n=1 Tax=Pedobacter punctiformis TaxID=3004097 RepID=A0ABT4L6L0_9SPHI|nr:hypothetical protein [Pedobacter sp. HCMS5-2]MCZ4243545.1 hypothetical protein [Pedobacter sp. HCMS5-2]
MKKTLKLVSLLFISSLFIFACKKKNNEAPYNPIKGAWVETPQQTYNRKIVFNDNGKFTMYMTNTIDANYLVTLNGTYTAQGENLTVNITEEWVKQSNGTVVKTQLPQQYNLFEKGTFNISNTVLTINYLTYPADAPVKTLAKFNKILAID